MNARQTRRNGAALALAIVATLTTASCSKGLPPRAAAQHFFYVVFDTTTNCPTGKDSAGPPGSECPGQARAECLKVPRGNALRFQARPARPGYDFVVDFAGKSPFAGEGPSFTTKDGAHEAATRTDGPSGEKFTFKVEPVAGSGCKPFDPQIILE